MGRERTKENPADAFKKAEALKRAGRIGSALDRGDEPEEELDQLTPGATVMVSGPVGRPAKTGPDRGFHSRVFHKGAKPPWEGSED